MDHSKFVKDVIARSKQPLPENASYEYEVRFLNYDRLSFERLKEKLKAMSNNPEKKEWKPFVLTETDDFVISGRRYSSIPGSDNLRMMDKIGILFKKDNNMKYALSQEREAGVSEDVMFVDGNIKFLSDVKEVELRRKKIRTTFPVNEIMIDMTEVVQNGVVKYEVEIEIEPKYLKKRENLFNGLSSIIEKMMPSYDGIIQFFNESMTSGKKSNKDALIFGTVARARDLKLEDITTGGVLKNYNVSVKADGEQRFLVTHKSGLWLIYPKNMITRLGDLPDDMQEGSIIAGELLSKDKIRDKSIYVDAEQIFIPFDATMIRGENVSRNNYEDRLNKMYTVLKEASYIKVNQVNKLYIMQKKYFKINSKDTFYKAMLGALEERKKVIYKEDGLVFTPIKSGYTPSGSSKPFKDRVLNKHSDICKWKPSDKLTIDFMYEYNGEHIIKTKEKDVVNFKIMPISKHFTFIELDALKTKSGSIVEFKPVEVKDGHIVLKPDRIRGDKIFPNEYFIVENLYQLLMNPIMESTLLGQDTVLMRKFHNSLKRELLNDVSNDSYLIDIGSGKGGDLSKWKKFKKVLAIEPNVGYIHEFERRLEERGMRDKVDILNARGEDTDMINDNVCSFLPDDLEGKKVYVSFMFSLSFFWESEKALQSLADTINSINRHIIDRDGDRCEIVFTTIDGKRLNSLLENFNSSKVPGTRSVDLNTIMISNKEGEKDLKISIKDSKTVTETQTEYFVHINQLLEKINYMTPRLIYASNETTKIIMSEAEVIYSSLVIYGRAVYSTEKVVETPDSRLPVFLDVAIEKDGKKYFKGDDKLGIMPHLGKGVYRIATIDNGVSLLHSVLKLISKEYVDEDASQRHERCDKFIQKLNYNLAIDNITMVSGYKINVIEGTSMKKYGSEDKEIFLFLNKDGSFEPLVKKVENGEYCNVFE